MIEKLLELGGGRLLIPLVVVAAGVALAKGVFNLTRSRSQDRRDYLDLCRGRDEHSDLWVTVSVRHVFGAYLPPVLIRQLMSGPQPGRALREVAGAWSFLDMNDETGEVSWRKTWMRATRTRKVMVRILAILYLLSGTFSLWLGYLCLAGAFHGKLLWTAWLYACVSAFIAVGCLLYGDSLSDADKAARRWLGLA